MTKKQKTPQHIPVAQLGDMLLRALDVSAYASSFLCAGVREDGRAFTSSRSTALTGEPLAPPASGHFQGCSGSALARLGGTVALAIARAQLLPRSEAAAERARAAMGSSSSGGGGGGRGACGDVTVLLPPSAASCFCAGSTGGGAAARPMASTDAAPPSADSLAVFLRDALTASTLPSHVALLLGSSTDDAATKTMLDEGSESDGEGEVAATAEEGFVAAPDSSDDDAAAGAAPPQSRELLLQIDVTVTAFDGNAADACLLAVVAAVLRLALPPSAGGGSAGAALAAAPRALAEMRLPLPCSFALVDLAALRSQGLLGGYGDVDGSSGAAAPTSVAAASTSTVSGLVILVDPTCLEEGIAHSRATLVLAPTLGEALAASATAPIVPPPLLLYDGQAALSGGGLLASAGAATGGSADVGLAGESPVVRAALREAAATRSRYLCGLFAALVLAPLA